jgi:hypothetical protein
MKPIEVSLLCCNVVDLVPYRIGYFFCFCQVLFSNNNLTLSTFIRNSFLRPVQYFKGGSVGGFSTL